ncbi:hypothetical protein [Bergeyella zoohelcum]|uniref:Uncharacterized protein n=1 Tax=Bergeyella zoohelcum TaxID=1015 RepID=A0A7Z9CEW7_9FLAO|nr:hypothetical protein [Bergeyella zoohelcum]VDH02673.1 Uncharacterised protein [Bergeyella zoohelcum]
MNKTTIKISVLAFLGFMTYGYAQQQQQDPHRGKVGVNTTEPSATMDIRPNDENARVEAKTNEGIIAPKLSKTRIANIETPVEGTLVYATDETTSPISAYTGGDMKVAKITEKGYYFYNGTEWVKAGNNSLAVDGSKWTNDTANNVVKLTNLSDGISVRLETNQIKVTDVGSLHVGDWSDKDSNAKIGARLSNNEKGGVILVDGTKATGHYAAFVAVDDTHSAYVMKNGNSDTNDNFNNWQIESFKSFPQTLFIQNYLDPTNKIKFVIKGNGNVGLGGVANPTERLHILGKIKASSLSGTGDRIVVADQDGVLKTSQFIMKATDTSSSCNQDNEGAIHYKTIMKSGKQVGVFGFCTRDAQGNYKWAYNVGGNNAFDGTGSFGSGL